MQDIFNALNSYATMIKQGKPLNPISIRRITFDDRLIDDELIINNENKDALPKLLEQYNSLKQAQAEYFKKQDFEEAALFRDKAKEINKQLSAYIETATFKSGNVFALTDKQIIVYTSKYLIKDYFKFDFLKEKTAIQDAVN